MIHIGYKPGALRTRCASVPLQHPTGGRVHTLSVGAAGSETSPTRYARLIALGDLAPYVRANGHEKKTVRVVFATDYRPHVCFALVCSM